MADAALRKSRSLCKGKFTRLINGISNKHNTLSETLLHSKLVELKAVWNEVQEKHDELILVTKDGESTEEDDEWINNLQNIFEEWEEKLDKRINEKNTGNNNLEEIEKQKVEKDLKDAKALLDVQIVNEEAKFKQTVSAINELLQRTVDIEHIPIAAASALSSLEAIKTNLEKDRNDLIKLLVQSDEEIPVEISQSLLKSEKEYNEMCTKVNVFSSKHTIKSQHNDSQTTAASSSANNSSIRPTKLPFEKFAEDIRKYPTFKSEFINHVKPKY